MRTRRSASSSSNSVSSSPLLKVTTNPSSATLVGHKPVLLHEVLQTLAIQTSDIVVDATLGGGGHAREIVKALDSSGTFVGLDADSAALERTRTALYAAPSAAMPKVHLVQSNFRKLEDVLQPLGIARIDKSLFDLGWSGFQLAAGRGFSFLADEPLLMTYADVITPTTLTAEIVVNTWAESSLADVIYGWGEERNAKRVAKAIVEAREQAPIKTSKQLADIVEGVVRRIGKTHPATRTFQALRIAVNDEFGAMKQGLNAAWRMTAKGGRIAVITLHSTEDREVKQVMKAWEKAGEARRLTKSPVVPTRDEIRENPRARSAKLRVVERI